MDNQDKPQSDYERKFVLIPHEIFADKELTPTDKLVFGRIYGFEIFFESAARTAEILGISERQVKRSRQTLESADYITCIKETAKGKQYRANERKLRGARLAQGCQIGTDGVTNCPKGVPNWPTEYKDSIKIEERLKEKQTKEKTEQQFGNPDINALLDAWAEATGFNYKNQKMERYAMAGLLKTHGLDATKALINRVKLARRSGDRFAPQIAKPSQLRGKYSKFEALTLWAERREAEQSKAPTGPIIPKNPDYFYEDPDAYDTGETREEIHERCEKLREKYGFGPRRELD